MLEVAAIPNRRSILNDGWVGGRNDMVEKGLITWRRQDNEDFNDGIGEMADAGAWFVVSIFVGWVVGGFKNFVLRIKVLRTRTKT